MDRDLHTGVTVIPLDAAISIGAAIGVTFAACCFYLGMRVGAHDLDLFEHQVCGEPAALHAASRRP